MSVDLLAIVAVTSASSSAATAAAASILAVELSQRVEQYSMVARSTADDHGRHLGASVAAPSWPPSCTSASSVEQYSMGHARSR